MTEHSFESLSHTIPAFFFFFTHPKQSSLEHQRSSPDGSKTLPVFLKDVSYQHCLLFVKRIHHKHLFHPSKERVS